MPNFKVVLHNSIALSLYRNRIYVSVICTSLCTFSHPSCPDNCVPVLHAWAEAGGHQRGHGGDSLLACRRPRGERESSAPAYMTLYNTELNSLTRYWILHNILTIDVHKVWHTRSVNYQLPTKFCPWRHSFSSEWSQDLLLLANCASNFCCCKRKLSNSNTWFQIRALNCTKQPSKASIIDHGHQFPPDFYYSYT